MSSSVFKIAYEIFAVDKFTDTFAKFSKGGAATDRALRGMAVAGTAMTGVGVALGGSLIYATTQAALFEREMSAVKAVSGASGREFEVLSAKAREMGEKTSFSAQEAAEGLKYLALAGWKTQEMLDGIQPVLYLAEAGNMELGRAADLASDTMAALGIKAKDTEYYLDRIAQTSRNSNTDVTQLMNAFRIGGGQLQSLNVPLEESASLFGIMANRGFKAEQAGRAMNAIIANMTTGFGRAGKAMEEIGVSAFDAEGNFIGLEATFRKVIDATKDMNDEDRNRIYMMIAGKDHIKTFNALLNGMGEEYDELKLKNINATGALTEMRDEMKNNLFGAVERLVSIFKELAISVGEILLPVVTSMVEGLINVVDWFVQLSDETKRTIAFTTAISSGFLIVAGTITTLVGVVGRIVYAFAQLGVNMKALIGFGTRLTGVFGIIATAGFMLYKKTADQAIDATVDFGDSVSDVTAEAVDGYRNMSSDVASHLRSYADAHATITQDVAKELLENQKKFNDTTIANIDHRQQQEIERTKKHFGVMGATTESEQKELLAKVNKHYDDQRASVEEGNKTINRIYEMASKEKRELTQAELTAIESLREQAQVVAISAIAQSQAEQVAIMEAFSAQKEALTTEEATRAVQQSIERKDAIVQQAEEEFEELVAFAIQQRDVIGSISDEEASKIIENATRQRDALVGEAESAHEGVVTAAQERAGDNVDLVNWETGEMLSGWQLFLAKLTSIWDNVKRVLSTLEPVLNFIKDITNTVIGFVADFISEKAQVISKYWSENSEQLKEATSNAWEFIKKVVNFVMPVIQGIITVGMGAIKFIVETVWGTIQSIIDGVLKVITGLLDVFIGVFTGDWSRMWSGIWDIVKGAATVILSVITGNIFGKIGKAFTTFASKALTKMGTLIKDLLAKVTGKASDFVTAGKDLVLGIIKGIGEKAADAVKAIGDMATKMFEKFTGIFKIFSPSRKMRDASGHIVDGAVVGIERNSHKADKAMEVMAEGMLSITDKYVQEEKKLRTEMSKEISKIEAKRNEDIIKIRRQASEKKRKLTVDESMKIQRLELEASDKIEKLRKKHVENILKIEAEKQKDVIAYADKFIEEGKRKGEISIDMEIRMWNELKRQSKVGSEQYEKALENHQKAVAEIRKEMESINKQYSEAILKVDEKLIADTKKVNDEYAKELESRTKGFFNFANLFDEFKENTKATGSELVSNLEGQVKALQEYEVVMASLGGKLGDSYLLEHLQGLGVKSLGELKELNQLSEEELDKYASLFEKKYELASQLATKELEPLAKDTQKAIADLEKAATSELDKLNKEWQNAIKGIVTGSKKQFDSMRQVGIDAITGLENGMISMQSSLMKTANDIADSVSKTISSALEIHSPSRLLERMGVNVGEGLDLGILSMIKTVQKTSKKLAEATMLDLTDVEVAYKFKEDISKSTIKDFSTNSTINLNDSELIKVMEELSEALEQGSEGAYGDVYVQIDGSTVETMRHAQDFFATIRQEVERRKN